MEERISEKHFLSFMNYAEDRDNIYFVDEIWNCVYKMKKSDYSVELLGFDVLNYGRSNVYKWIAKWEDTVVLIPQHLKNAIFIITKECERHSRGDASGKDIIVSGCAQNNQYLYIFTNDSKVAIIIYDICEDKFWQGFNWAKYTMKYGELTNCKWLPGRSIMTGDKLLFPIRNTNKLAEYDMKTHRMKLISMHKDYLLSFAIRRDGEMLWIIEKGKNKLLKFRLSNDEVEVFIEINLSDYFDSSKYEDFEIDLPYVYFLPREDEEILRFDVETMETLKIVYPDNFRWIKDRRYYHAAKFIATARDKDYLYLYPRVGNGILRIKRKSMDIHCIHLVENMKQIYREIGKNVDLTSIKEWDGDIESLIDLVQQRDKPDIERKMDIGNMIWDTVK